MGRPEIFSFSKIVFGRVGWHMLSISSQLLVLQVGCYQAIVHRFLARPAAGEGPPMPIRWLAGYRGGSADGVLQCPAVGEPGSCFSVPWPSFSCLPCYGCRCLLEFEGVFFIENLEFFDFARKCTETWHVATHAGDGARQHLTNQHRN